tara:strand:+ start:27 stop:644 length:618 start_codon:yes stop_codon:yes gene_type:complete
MTTAWFDKTVLPNSMVNAKFKCLEESEHFDVLKACFDVVRESKTLLDLGCGAAEVSRVFNNFDYTGADLPHIIDGVSKTKNPNVRYIKFDIEKDSLHFLNGKDVILMNSLISEIPNWYRALTKVLVNAEKYIILHRQTVTEEKSTLVEYNTYGGLLTTNSIINQEELIRLFEMNDFEKIYEANSFKHNRACKSFVFEKQGGSSHE